MSLFEENIGDNDHHEELIKNAELEEFPQKMEQLNKWSIPKEDKSKIYSIGMLDFRSRMAIKTMEQTVRMSKQSQTIKLLSRKDLQNFINYKFIHIGLVQIAFKPLTLLGM